MDNIKKYELLSLTPDELVALMGELGEPKFRAKQLFEQMHRGLSPDDMSNIGKVTREKIYSVATFHLPAVRRKLVSKIDGTVKYLFELSDGHCVESVVMKYKHGNTICVSSQVGCRMGCVFCASTIGGRVRDLSAGEIVGQVIAAQKDMGERISNIVMMGIGEPLDNYDNVIKFLHIVNHEYGLNIGYRHISLSTCGIIDKIYRLREENLPLTLSISLHAADDETRSAIMPINQKWNIKELLSACVTYYQRTSRRISFEYTLIAGKNDTGEDARALARLLLSHFKPIGAPVHVNLIRVNEVKETGMSESSVDAANSFARTLTGLGVTATVRRRLGADIDAACGQLRAARMGKTEDKWNETEK